MTSFKRKRLSFSEKYTAITEVQSGTKPSKAAEIYGVLRKRYQHDCCLEIKKKN